MFYVYIYILYIYLALYLIFSIKLCKLHKNIVIFSSPGRWRQWRIYLERWVHGVHIPQAFTVWWRYVGILRISDSCRACQFFVQTTEKKFDIRGNIQTQINCNFCWHELFIMLWHEWCTLITRNSCPKTGLYCLNRLIVLLGTPVK